MAIDPLPQRVHGDERKLRQILTNLLANAVKLTESGHVALNVLARADERYFFEVVDTGPGLPAERQARMFAPFEQEQSGRDKGGTGLGLAIASRYALLLGGRLEVESKPGAETRFFLTLRLPASEERAATVAEDPWARASSLAPATPVQALVVDDVAENREVLAGMLERIGARVASASTGEEAIECARLAPPDIVFMDIRLPGLSGVEVRDRIEAVHGAGAMKFVAVSASVLPQERQSCMEQGFDEFIDKPVRMESVYASLSRLLGAQFLFEAPGESGADELSAVELRALELPGELFKALTQALQAHNMSQTRRLLEQMEAAGGSERRLARHLRILDRRYDLRAILDVLKEVRHG
jgi:CheY-like chemotaxis protein